MQERHFNRKKYFDEQGITTEKYVIPYIEECFPISKTTRVLEIGCGEGGNLMPFVKRGCETVGVDLNKGQIEKAKTFFAQSTPNAKVTLISEDIFKVGVETVGQFDLIMMRDVIEHIHNQEKFMHFLKLFLKPNGKVFFGFPPWRMPFGGHQQICASKLLSKLPWFHLLNKHIYRFILKSFGEKKHIIEELLEIKETGISINRFQRIIKTEQYQFDKKDLYFINPNYEIKFGLNPRILNKGIASIPYVRDFFTTCYYCLLSVK